ncbi:MAG: HNH endonuclease [Candidatus Limnocylindria bacterium]
MPYKDPDARRAYGRDRMRRNPDKAREAMRRWREKHAEQDRAGKREWYARYREAESAKRALYVRTHPEIQTTRRRNRRALTLGAAGSHTTSEWLALVAAYAGRCAYCGVEGRLQADHALPLSRGGSHFIENIRPACLRCNARKRTLTEDEFRARLAAEAAGVRWVREAPIEWTYDAAG